MNMNKIEKRGYVTQQDYNNYTTRELDVIAAAAEAAAENAEDNCFMFEDLVSKMPWLSKAEIKGLCGSLCHKAVFFKQDDCYWDFQFNSQYIDLACRCWNER